MANINAISLALKTNIYDFVRYVMANYTGGASDMNENYVYIDEPFVIDTEENLKSRFQQSGYHFVIANTRVAPRGDYPNNHIVWQFSCDIYVIRRTLQPRDITNKRNIVLYGGTDGAGGVITSMQRICGDMSKYFRVFSLGGKLPVSGTDHAFKCDIAEISELQNLGNFFYCVCSFEALDIETTTISAT